MQLIHQATDQRSSAFVSSSDSHASWPTPSSPHTPHPTLLLLLLSPSLTSPLLFSHPIPTACLLPTFLLTSLLFPFHVSCPISLPSSPTSLLSLFHFLIHSIFPSPLMHFLSFHMQAPPALYSLPFPTSFIFLYFIPSSSLSINKLFLFLLVLSSDS